MIAGNQLAKQNVEQTPHSSSVSNPRIAWHEVRFQVRIIAKLRAAIEARDTGGL
jgi:hypothetical protein